MSASFPSIMTLVQTCSGLFINNAAGKRKQPGFTPAIRNRFLMRLRAHTNRSSSKLYRMDSSKESSETSSHGCSSGTYTGCPCSSSLSDIDSISYFPLIILVFRSHRAVLSHGKFPGTEYHTGVRKTTNRKVNTTIPRP